VTAANAFLVNEPAARALANGSPVETRAAEERDLIALWRKCPHLACQVPALCESTKRFECLCHGSTYNILGEKLLKGPAERGMDRFPVTVDDEGTVIIDTSEVIRGAPEGSVTFRDPYPPEVGCA
jgi:Rieske Fe-S protein